MRPDIAKIIILLSAIIGLSVAGCQQTDDSNAAQIIPTFAPTPLSGSISATPSQTPFTFPSPAPSFTPSTTPSVTTTPSATITATPTQVTLTPSPTSTITPIPLPSATRQRPPLPEAFTFGKSVEGRDLLAYRFGNGGALLMLVGGIHTGFENHTAELVQRLAGHYRMAPGDVLPGVTLVLIPALNPDGQTYGRVLRGRYNANGVDLNRNWACGWQEVAYFQDEEVNPGTEPFSEPESIALAALINDLRPDAVLFYHAAANGVIPGRCDDIPNGEALAQVYATSSRYPYHETFDDYVVTGSAPDWVDSLGIPAADVELASAELTEFERNLRAVTAVQCWLMGQNASSLMACNR